MSQASQIIPLVQTDEVLYNALWGFVWLMVIQVHGFVFHFLQLWELEFNCFGFYNSTSDHHPPDCHFQGCVQRVSIKVLKVAERLLPSGLSEVLPNLSITCPENFEGKHLEDAWFRHFQVMGLAIPYHADWVHVE